MRSAARHVFSSNPAAGVGLGPACALPCNARGEGPAVILPADSGARAAMTGAATVMQRLFGPPGGSGTSPAHLLKQAASAHAALLSRAAEQEGRCRDPSLAPVMLFLRGPASAGEKRRLLC